MRYTYGGNLSVVAPTGRTLPAQMSDWNDGDPVIIVPAYQMEVPAAILREEGWHVPEIGGNGDSAYEPTTMTATAGSQMGDATGDLENIASFHDTNAAVESAAREIVKALLEDNTMTAPAPVKMMKLPYRSRTRGMVNVQAEVHGNVAVFQDDNGHWTARNLRTQNVISAPDKEDAIQAVAY